MYNLLKREPSKSTIDNKIDGLLKKQEKLQIASHKQFDNDTVKIINSVITAFKPLIGDYKFRILATNEPSSHIIMNVNYSLIHIAENTGHSYLYTVLHELGHMIDFLLEERGEEIELDLFDPNLVNNLPTDYSYMSKEESFAELFVTGILGTNDLGIQFVNRLLLMVKGY